MPHTNAASGALSPPPPHQSLWPTLTLRSPNVSSTDLTSFFFLPLVCDNDQDSSFCKIFDTFLCTPIFVGNKPDRFQMKSANAQRCKINNAWPCTIKLSNSCFYVGKKKYPSSLNICVLFIPFHFRAFSFKCEQLLSISFIMAPRKWAFKTLKLASCRSSITSAFTQAGVGVEKWMERNCSWTPWLIW